MNLETPVSILVSELLFFWIKNKLWVSELELNKI